MAKKIAISKLNATTLDILNVIRENASAEYRNKIPEITDIKDLPRVGDIIYGYPALANEFIALLKETYSSEKYFLSLFLYFFYN